MKPENKLFCKMIISLLDSIKFCGDDKPWKGCYIGVTAYVEFELDDFVKQYIDMTDTEREWFDSAHSYEQQDAIIGKLKAQTAALKQIFEKRLES